MCTLLCRGSRTNGLRCEDDQVAAHLACDDGLHDEGSKLIVSPQTAGNERVRRRMKMLLIVALALACAVVALRLRPISSLTMSIVAVNIESITQQDENRRGVFLDQLHMVTVGKPWKDVCKIYNFVTGAFCNTSVTDTFSQCPRQLRETAQAFNGSNLTASDRTAIYAHMMDGPKRGGFKHCVPDSLCGAPEGFAGRDTHGTSLGINYSSVRGGRLCDGGVTKVYHVTSMWACQRILADGFDIELSEKGSLGRGVYFSRSKKTAAWRTRHNGCVIIVAVRFGTERRLSCSGWANGCEGGWTWLPEWAKDDPGYGKTLACDGYDSLHSWKHGAASSIFFTDQVVDMIAYPTCGWKGCTHRTGAWLNGRSQLHIPDTCNANAYGEKCTYSNTPEECMGVVA